MGLPVSSIQSLPMYIRTIGVVVLVCSGVVAGLPAQSKTFPVSELKPGMVATGRTVFQGDQLEEFKAHILGVLHNSIGPRRDLILARLEGGPLANTGVIAGMSGSPVYIDGRLVGAVSYSLGEFSKEPLAGITPIEEMIADATLPGQRAQVARAELTLPVTQEGLRESLRQAFSWIRPFADSPADVRVIGGGSVNAGIATLLRPIATPINFSGFDTRSGRSARLSLQGTRLHPGHGRCRSAGFAVVGRVRTVELVDVGVAARRSSRRRTDERRPRGRCNRHGDRGGR